MPLIRFIYLFLLISLVAFFYNAPKGMDVQIMSILIVIVLLCLILFIFKKEKNEDLKGQFFKHSTLVLIGVVVVHFQYNIDYVLGNSDPTDLYIWINPAVVTKTLSLSIIGLLSFFLGYLFYKKSKKIERKKTKAERTFSVKILLWLATLLLIGYFIYVNPLYLSGYYGAERIGEEAGYLILFFKVIIFAIIIQNCRNILVSGKIPTSFKAFILLQGKHLLILLGVYLLSVLISGDRGPIMIFGLTIFAGYFFVTKKRLSVKQGLLFIFVGASIITLLGHARAQDRELSFGEKISEGLNSESRFKSESFLPQTQELATSVRTLHSTVNYIPEKHDYMYGRFQFQQLTVALPFFSNFNELIFEQSYKYKGSSSFVTWINQGDNPYSGDGTSCIADFYFDFGLIGVIVGMFIFGYYIRFAEISMYSNVLPSLFANCFFIVYIANAIYISRSSFLIEMKATIWVFFILLCNRYFFNKSTR